MGAVHPLLTNATIHLAAWKITGKSSLHEEFLKTLPCFLRSHGDPAQGMLTILSGKNGMAAAVRDALIRFECGPYDMVVCVEFLSKLSGVQVSHSSWTT